MCQRMLRDARFHSHLFRIDGDLAAQAKALGCRSCGHALHQANYQRQVRGVPGGVGGDFDWRYSFCCSERDCRKRLTPTSVRFLDGRVYQSVMVVLAAVLAQGLSRSRVQILCKELGVDKRTLERWRSWWQEDLPRTDCWTELRLQLRRQPDAASLPTSLLEQIEAADEHQRLLLLLDLLKPLSHSRLMRERFSRAA